MGKPRTNARGNLVFSGFHHSERYHWDFDVCTKEKGWKQYDTKQDAWYFGIWVHPEKRLIFTYAEGDTTLVKCPTEESYHAELKNMAEFYGPPPPAFVTYDLPSGKRTEFYDTRPV
jgi:hypothetical protein